MGGLNIAFNTIQSALEATQEAINVTANNVGNANTAGYTRETVSWQETDPVTISGQQIGTGVTISGVTSQRSLVLNQAIDQAEQALSQATSRAGGLTDVPARMLAPELQQRIVPQQRRVVEYLTSQS